MRYQKLLQSLDPPPLPAGVSLFQEVFVQTIDLEKLDYRAIHQQLTSVLEGLAKALESNQE